MPELYKRPQSMKSETLSLKTIIKELDFVTKIIIVQWKTWKKDSLLLVNKLIEKIPNPRNTKEHYQLFIRKKTIRTNCISTKNFWKAKKIINESDIVDMFKSIYTTVILKIQKSLGKVSGWTIDFSHWS